MMMKFGLFFRFEFLVFYLFKKEKKQNWQNMQKKINDYSKE